MERWTQMVSNSYELRMEFEKQRMHEGENRWHCGLQDIGSDDVIWSCEWAVNVAMSFMCCSNID